MNDEKIFDMFQRLTDQLRETTDSINKIISNHETRIVVLETTKRTNDDGWKTQLLMLLSKAVVIGAVSIASLVGAGSLIAKVLGLQ